MFIKRKRYFCVHNTNSFLFLICGWTWKIFWLNAKSVCQSVDIFVNLCVLFCSAMERIEKWYVGRRKLIIRQKKQALSQWYDTQSLRYEAQGPLINKHLRRHKNFDGTAVVDRLRTVGGNERCHPNGVFNWFTSTNRSTSRKSRVINKTRIRNLLISLHV